MPTPQRAKSCSSNVPWNNPNYIPHRGSMTRLSKRAAVTHLRLGHDYLDLLAANRRRNNPDKQTRLIAELKAEIAMLKALLARHAQPGARHRPRSAERV